MTISKSTNSPKSNHRALFPSAFTQKSPLQILTDEFCKFKFISFLFL